MSSHRFAVVAFAVAAAVAACAPAPVPWEGENRGTLEGGDDAGVDVADDIDGDTIGDGDPVVDEPVVDEPVVDEPVVEEDPSPPGWSALESEMLALVNAFRTAGGTCPSGTFSPLPPLAANDALWRAARAHSDDMVRNAFFDHVGSNGSTFADRIVGAGYAGQPRGENIAAGNTDARAAFEQWHTSDGHCRNMTSTGSNEIGIGFASGGEWGAYWTQTFGAR